MCYERLVLSFLLILGMSRGQDILSVEELSGSAYMPFWLK